MGLDRDRPDHGDVHDRGDTGPPRPRSFRGAGVRPRRSYREKPSRRQRGVVGLMTASSVADDRVTLIGDDITLGARSVRTGTWSPAVTPSIIPARHRGRPPKYPAATPPRSAGSQPDGCACQQGARAGQCRDRFGCIGCRGGSCAKGIRATRHRRAARPRTGKSKAFSVASLNQARGLLGLTFLPDRVSGQGDASDRTTSAFGVSPGRNWPILAAIARGYGRLIAFGVGDGFFK